MKVTPILSPPPTFEAFQLTFDDIESISKLVGKHDISVVIKYREGSTVTIKLLDHTNGKTTTGYLGEWIVFKQESGNYLNFEILSEDEFFAKYKGHGD